MPLLLRRQRLLGQRLGVGVVLHNRIIPLASTSACRPRASAGLTSWEGAAIELVARFLLADRDARREPCALAQEPLGVQAGARAELASAS